MLKKTIIVYMTAFVLFFIFKDINTFYSKNYNTNNNIQPSYYQNKPKGPWIHQVSRSFISGNLLCGTSFYSDLMKHPYECIYFTPNSFIIYNSYDTTINKGFNDLNNPFAMKFTY